MESDFLTRLQEMQSRVNQLKSAVRIYKSSTNNLNLVSKLEKVLATNKQLIREREELSDKLDLNIAESQTIQDLKK